MKIRLLSFALLGLASALAARSQTYPLSENFWSSPEFQDRVMGSYGFHTELEPKISEEEGLLFKELILLLDQSLEQGKRRLESELTADSSAALNFMLGTINLQLGDLEEAVASYKNAIRKFPNFMRAYKSAGYALVQQGKFEEAPEYLVKGLELGGGDGATYGLLGYSYLNQEHYGGALNAYNLAIAFAPETLDWQLGKTRCLMQLEDYAEAAGLIEDLIVAHPDRAEFWLHQANAKLAMENPRQAATSLEVVRRMGEATVESLSLLGDIYENLQMHRLAYEAYDEALGLEGGEKAVEGLVQVARSMIQYQAHEYADRMARLAFDKAGAALDEGQRLKLLNLQAEAQLASGDSEKAAATLEKIVEENPMDGQALLLLGRRAWKQKDYEEAAFLFERAANIEEFEAEALLKHGQMLVERKRYAEAAKLIRRSLELRYAPQVADYLRNVEDAAERTL